MSEAFRLLYPPRDSSLALAVTVHELKAQL